MYMSESRETLLEHSMQAERVWLGEIGIAEAAEFIAETAEGAISASSASFRGFSDSPLPHPGRYEHMSKGGKRNDRNRNF
jgi:hypothetical protein